jgi:hypothetical protein
MNQDRQGLSHSGLVSSFKKYKAVRRVIAATQSRFQERGIKQSIIFPNLLFFELLC